MNKKELNKLTQSALLTATLAVSSFISIPFAVPFTLQTLALAFCLASVGAMRTLKILAAYTFIGFCGVPVFSGFRSGFSAIAEPSGGYIVGFFVMTAFYGLLIKVLPSSKIKDCIALVLALVPMYLCASVWYAALYLDFSVNSFVVSFCVTSAPFILPDVLKVLFGGFCGKRIKKHLKNG